MAPDTIDPQIRALPLYRLGFNAGRDVGLVQALDALTAERGRLDALTDVTASSAHSPAPAHYAFADGRLAAVATVLGAIFRTTPGV